MGHLCGAQALMDFGGTLPLHWGMPSGSGARDSGRMEQEENVGLRGGALALGGL